MEGIASQELEQEVGVSFHDRYTEPNQDILQDCVISNNIEPPPKASRENVFGMQIVHLKSILIKHISYILNIQLAFKNNIMFTLKHKTTSFYLTSVYLLHGSNPLGILYTMRKAN